MKNGYTNRHEAGQKLASLLTNLIDQQTILFAIPRGGVAVAQPISETYHLPIHLLMIKKISHPENEELAIGACGPTEYLLEEKDTLTAEELNSTLKMLRTHLASRQSQLSSSLPLSDLSGKTVLLVDDGAATGLTLLCGIHELKKMHPTRILLAIPVAAEEAAQALKLEVDEFICPIVSRSLGAVGEFYQEFSQVSDEEVKELLLKVN